MAARLLNKSRISDGKKLASDPAFRLAAQLLAANPDVAAGAETCPAATTAINQAQALLDLINFNGNTYASMTTAQKNLANSLAVTLDSYNKNTLCP
jgi:thioredoxin-like negative regulator of GroEL